MANQNHNQQQQQQQQQHHSAAVETDSQEHLERRSGCIGGGVGVGAGVSVGGANAPVVGGGIGVGLGLHHHQHHHQHHHHQHHHQNHQGHGVGAGRGGGACAAPDLDGKGAAKLARSLASEFCDHAPHAITGSACDIAEPMLAGFASAWSGGAGGGGSAKPVNAHAAISDATPTKEPGRHRSARQYTWLLLLKAHRAAGCVACVGVGFMTTLRLLTNRLFSKQEGLQEDLDQELEEHTDSEEGEKRRQQTGVVSSRLLLLLQAVAALSFVLFLFEVASHWSELQLELQLHDPIRPALAKLVGIYQNWTSIRAQYVAPYLQSFADGCVYLFLIQSADRILLCLGCLWVKLSGYKPRLPSLLDDDYSVNSMVTANGSGNSSGALGSLASSDALTDGSVDNDTDSNASQSPRSSSGSSSSGCSYSSGGSSSGGCCFDDEDPERALSAIPISAYPMVLVQMPMCNEKEVYAASIAATCRLQWPAERMLIQVLDDSSDDECQKMIEAECEAWAARGAPIRYRHRVDRKGYKAGNLDSGMKCDYVKKYEFVAIFDADFQPKPDFLLLTVPHFKADPQIALVQARWSFVNKDENLLTKLQNINLQFHFEVEQQVNGAIFNFFGFNGTAGVWRISALEDSGGWLDRTTVEDMDIAVRAHLKGWKFIFLNDVEASCELPESYEAYRKQQHRWHSGPMQLFRLCIRDIIVAKIPWWKKLNVIFLFFLLRKMILPFYSFMLFCIILPLTMFVPEAQLPLWVVCYIPGFMSLLNVLPSPRSFPFMIPYLLFENTMSVTKFQAMVAGLFQLQSAHEWVVTKKTGRQQQPLSALDAHMVALSKKDSEGLHLSSTQAATSSSPADMADGPVDLLVTGSGSTSDRSPSPPPVAEDVCGPLAPVGASAGGSASQTCHQRNSSFGRVASEPVLLVSGTDGPEGAVRLGRVVPPRDRSPLKLSPGSRCGNEGQPYSSPERGQRVSSSGADAAVVVFASPKTPLLAGSGAVSVAVPVTPTGAPKKAPAKRLYRNEFALALLLLVAAGRSLLSVHGMHFYFLLFQGLSFLMVALDLISDRQ